MGQKIAEQWDHLRKSGQATGTGGASVSTNVSGTIWDSFFLALFGLQATQNLWVIRTGSSPLLRPLD